MKKVKRNAPDLRPPTKKEQIQIASNFAKIGKENGIVIHSCCEKTFLSEYGLKCNGCMSQEIVEKSINCKLEPPKRKNLRQECNCLMENDIGAYNTCGHLCKYCYANSNKGLVIENIKKHTRFHPRCGTSFLLFVMIVSILLFALLPRVDMVILRVLMRLALLPAVAGISFEIIKFAGRSKSKWVAWLSKPGLWLQKLTTREPDASQIEVAIESMKPCIPENKEDDRW